jgi:hypothetical protein
MIGCADKLNGRDQEDLEDASFTRRIHPSSNVFGHYRPQQHERAGARGLTLASERMFYFFMRIPAMFKMNIFSTAICLVKNDAQER